MERECIKKANVYCLLDPQWKHILMTLTKDEDQKRQQLTTNIQPLLELLELAHVQQSAALLLCSSVQISCTNIYTG